MEYILTSKKRKKHQRAVNKIVREMNQIIEKDELWRGRFVCRQKYSKFKIFEDGSGASLWVTLVLIDKKTGKVEYHIDSLVSKPLFSMSLFNKMNDFIINVCKVWEDETSPYEDKTDYRLIKFEKN